MATRRVYFDDLGNEIDARPARRPEPRASAGASLFNLACWCITALLLAFLVGALGPAFGVYVPYLADVADAVRARVQAPPVCQINGADVPCADFARLNNAAATAAAQSAPAVTAPTPQIALRVIGPDGISAAAPEPAALPQPIEQAAPVVAPVEVVQPPAALPQMAQDFVEAVAPPVEQAAPAAGNVCLAFTDGRCPAAAAAPAPESQPAPAPAAPVEVKAAPVVGAQAFKDAVAGPQPTAVPCLVFKNGVCPAGGGK